MNVSLYYRMLGKKVFRIVVCFMLVTCYMYITTYTKENIDKTTHISSRKHICDRMSGQSKHTVVRKDWNFTQFKRPRFLNNSKNPCFFQNVTIHLDSPKKRTTQLRFRCLPYFLIAGFPKAGTTDLWVLLGKHSDIKLRQIKEPRFFNIERHKETSFGKAAEKYISIFDRSAFEIHRHVSPLECNHHSCPYYHGITGEANVDTAFDNRFWKMEPGNEQCREPVITNADYVHYLNPDIRIIFIIRNPVERLYSDYIYEARFNHYSVNSQLFNEAVLDAIKNHTECRKYNSIRACSYNGTLETIKIRLRVGMYNIFISDWLEVFSHKNVLVVRSEDTAGPNRIATYRRILKFLSIRPFTRMEEVAFFHRGPTNARSQSERKLGDMLPETRTLIKNFYEPFNKELTKLFPDINYNIP